jgi:hypothetical protein
VQPPIADREFSPHRLTETILQLAQAISAEAKNGSRQKPD